VAENEEKLPLLSLARVSRVFAAGGGIQGIDLDLRPGEILGICGASGCGKSTLLRTIAGIVVPDSGDIRHRERRLAMVFQDPHLLPWLDAESNVRLVLKDGDQDETRQILAEVGLAAAGTHYPAQLSGGMRQRVGIARALVTKPDLLLMDEPLAALDYFNRLELLNLIRAELAQRAMATVFVSHDVREITQLCDRVLVLGGHPGKIVAMLDHPIARPDRLNHPGALAHLEERIVAIIGKGHDR
jgi:ABC-type nitrate/sulfonate/bicarbonate transport system ATPase subunit